MFSLKSKVGKSAAIKPVAIINDRGGDLDKELVYLYRKDDIDEENPEFFDDISLPKHSNFEYFPDIREDFADTFVLVGSRGSGKSTLASQIALKIKKVFDLPDDAVTIVKKSPMPDPAFEKLGKYSTILVNEDFLDAGYTCESFGDPSIPKVIILDDLDNINSVKLKRAYQTFQDDLYVSGRKYNLYVIVCRHSMAAGKDTKALLIESTYIVYFPDNLTSDFKYCLSKYCDMSDDLIREMKKIRSKWVMFHKDSPKFIISEFRMFIFDLDREEEIAAENKRERKRQLKEK